MTLRGAGVAVLATAALTLAPPSGGTAPPWSPLGVSRTGHVWSAALHQPLFAGHVVLVPGAVRYRTFYVRNQSHVGAAVDLGVGVSGRTGALRRRGIHFSLHVSAEPNRKVVHGR